MKSVVLGLFLITIVLSELTCGNNYVYTKFTFQASRSYADEDEFEVYDGTTLLYKSPMFEDNELRVIEYCLNATTNSQYTLKLKDNYGDSWGKKAHLKIEGIEGNAVFKSFMVADEEETYALSLYYGFNKAAQWKYVSSTVTGSWTEYNYDDALWNSITLGTDTTITGNAFFRKTFVGVANMAAYELSMKYRYGIVAYINGVEIYRDNMNEGAITPSEPTAGSYSESTFHNIIRPGNEVSNAQSVLAVEIHYLVPESENVIDFDGYLALLAPTTEVGSSMMCFVYPYNAVVGSDIGSNPQTCYDYDKTTNIYLSSSIKQPITVSYVLEGATPYINGLRIFPSTRVNYGPDFVVAEGTKSLTSPNWKSIFSVYDLTYVENQYKVVNTYFNPGFYKNLRFYMDNSETSMNLYELQPVVCNIPLPTSMDFPQATYSYFAKYEDFSISPSLNEFVNCTINPSPVAGLTFDSATCTLSGKVMTPTPATVYTVTTTMKGISYTGSFTLEIQDCTGTLVNIVRTYKSNAYKEIFTLKKASNQEVVLSVAENSGQISSQDWSTLICLTEPKYILTIGSTELYWTNLSFLYLNALLDGISDYETIVRARYDNNLNLPSEMVVNAAYSVPAYQQWHYKIGEVPANWYNSETSGWNTATAGSYPQSTNQIQLYKKTFSIASLDDVTGVSLSIKYQYGLIIYLNNHEAFRLGISGTLSTTSFSTVTLEDANYRQISLPIKTIAIGDTPAVNYLTTGTNTIAIAVVAVNAEQKVSTFDCAVRLIGGTSDIRSFDYTYIDSQGMSGSFRNIFDLYCGNSFYYNSCNSNYLEIALADHRHEWISSIMVGLLYNQANKHFKKFIVKAKNEDEQEWTTLANVNGLTWSIVGQRNHIWLQNNKAYNQFRFEDFGTGNPSNCPWQLGYLSLEMDATTVDIPALAYDTTTLSIYKDIEMAEVYPTSYYFRDFTVTPALPNGVIVDPYTGTISGTASTSLPSQTYTISAKTFTGTPVSTTITIDVVVCTGGKSLITLVARTDSLPAQSSYKVYQGKGTSGDVKYSTEAFVVPSALNYADFCLNHGIYTLELKDTADGWSAPAGYYMTVDVGEMKFEMGYVYSAIAPASVTTMFSSYLPFQIEYDDWKVFKDGTVADNWKEIDFDDSTWTTAKAAEIGVNEAITTYIRREVNIPDIADYQVLNVRVKYAGGVVAYFNGRKVARFNLIEDFTALTESIDIHNENTFSMFHIILSTSGGVTGKNIMAFEIHRPTAQSSAEPVVFDATGVFGVNECSLLVDSFYDIDGTKAGIIGTSSVKLENYFDYTTATSISFPNSANAYLQWSIENLEGNRFNSFAMQTAMQRTGFGFSLYGKFTEEEEETTLYDIVSTNSQQRARIAFPVPVGIAAFRHFRFVLDKPANAVIPISAFIHQYCKTSGEGVCPGVGDYPAVAEGAISPGICPSGFTGYSYRECNQGVLGEIKTDKCTYKLPAELHYSVDRFTFVKDIAVSIPAPTYINIIEKFYLAENEVLPAGLVLDEVTGVISGIPTETMDIKMFKIYGENPRGVTSTEISIAVRVGECKAEGKFMKTVVGETAIHECSADGSYIGTQKRACVLGATDGEWQKIEGMCILVSVLVIVIVVVIIIIMIIIFVVIRVSKKKKVGGVKGKKKATVTKPEKSATKKEVKV